MAEIALSVALVALAGLLIQSMLAIQRTNLGFDPQNVFTLQFRLPATKYRTPDEIARFFKAARERVSSVPGITSAALVRRVPLSGNRGNTAYTLEGLPGAVLSALTKDLDDRHAILLADFNWQLVNGLAYFGKVTRPDLAYAWMSHVLMYAPALIADNVALSYQLLPVHCVEQESHAVTLEPQRQFHLVGGYRFKIIGAVKIG